MGQIKNIKLHIVTDIKRIVMTFHGFMDLPAELRLKIFACCQRSELKNISLTSKQCRDETQQPRCCMELSGTSLTMLDLERDHALTNKSLELISTKLLRLNYIDVTCEKFTVEGLYHLLALPNLNDVDYNSSEITDEHLDEFYDALESKCK